MNPYARTIQKLLTTTSSIMCREPELVTGRGSLYEIIVRLKALGHTRVMVATTEGTMNRGVLDLFLEELEHAQIHTELFTKIKSDPTVELVEELAAAYKEHQCQAMIAIGGGSVIDCAKAALARVVKPQRSLRQLRGIMNVRHPIPDFFAVPTTAGTGSEATAAAVITDTIDGSHYKYAISDPSLIPSFAVLDPSLTVTLSPRMTAASGLDALTHAVEAYTNRFASDRVKSMSKAAVKLIFSNLLTAYEHGDDLKAREEMLMGSFYAGIAFTNNFVGYVHAVAHALGGIYGLSHGRTVATVLPYVMEQFGSCVYKPLAELAVTAGFAVADDDEEEAAYTFLQGILTLEQKMEIPDKIPELRVEDYPEIITRAIKEANPTYPVPQIWGKKEFKILLDRLLVVETEEKEER